jgi:Ras-related protein Rab-5C
VVFDVCSERSFRRAQHWVGELRRNAAGQPLLALVGNKADLPLEERAVEAEEARALADR